jgi:hypothetical protein
VIHVFKVGDRVRLGLRALAGATPSRVLPLGTEGEVRHLRPDARDEPKAVLHLADGMRESVPCSLLEPALRTPPGRAYPDIGRGLMP